jgi:hypothetical protein
MLSAHAGKATEMAIRARAREAMMAFIQNFMMKV